MANLPTAWAAPDFFVGKPSPLGAYEPYPILTGSNFSSVGPASAAGVHWVQPGPLVFQNIIVQNSMAAVVASASSAASTGSEAYSYAVSAFIYSRQDYAANSSNLFPVVSGSFGLTATLGYSSTSQQFGMSWVTDTTGGTSAFTTTSASDGWSNFASGAKVIGLPMVTTLQAGEYWIAFQHSSTAATSNSAVTLLSMSQLGMGAGQQASVTAGFLGASVTTNNAYGGAQDYLLIATTPVFSTTMALASFLAGGNRGPWFNFRNCP